MARQRFIGYGKQSGYVEEVDDEVSGAMHAGGCTQHTWGQLIQTTFPPAQKQDSKKQTKNTNKKHEVRMKPKVAIACHQRPWCHPTSRQVEQGMPWQSVADPYQPRWRPGPKN